MENKICKKCGLEKNISDFYKGLNQCKACRIEYQKELSIKQIISDLEKISKKCIKCNIEKDIINFNKYGNKCKECEKICYNKEKTSIRKKKYNLNNPGHRKEYWSNYYNTNKNDIIEKSRKRYSSEYKKQYYIDNKEKILKNVKERFNHRIKTDIIYRLKYSLKGVVRNSLLNKGFKKNDKTETIIGITIPEFKLYIESKFESWMTWENRGLYNGELNYGWDIDHIIPTSSAKSEEEIIKLNHYTNLQPLDSYINRYVKRDKLGI